MIRFRPTLGLDPKGLKGQFWLGRHHHSPSASHHLINEKWENRDTQHNSRNFLLNKRQSEPGTLSSERGSCFGFKKISVHRNDNYALVFTWTSNWKTQYWFVKQFVCNFYHYLWLIKGNVENRRWFKSFKCFYSLIMLSLQPFYILIRFEMKMKSLQRDDCDVRESAGRAVRVGRRRQPPETSTPPVLRWMRLYVPSEHTRRSYGSHSQDRRRWGTRSVSLSLAILISN